MKLLRIKLFFKLRYHLYLFLLGFSIMSCTDQPDWLEKDLTVAEVRAHYDQLMAHNPAGRQATDSMAIDWESAEYRETNLGDALTFSLSQVSHRYVSNEEGGRLYPVIATGYAISYRSEGDELQLEYVQAMPTAATEQFTGYLTVTDWNGEAKQVILFVNGRPLGADQNGREESCKEIFYFNCTDVHVNGELYSTYCEYSHSAIICDNLHTPPSLEPEDYSPKGAYPKDMELCPNPEVEGEYVDCSQLECPGNFEPDPEGGCRPICPEGHIRDEFGHCNDPGDCNTTYERLQNAYPEMSEANAKKLAEVINEYGKEFGIDNVHELHHFLGQSNHELGGFGDLSKEESLHYSASRLIEVFPSKFSAEGSRVKKKASDYAGNSEKLGNYVYANKNGNGGVSTGDGYKYRGRGLFQLTGKANYRAFSDFYQQNYDASANFLTNPEQVASDTDIAVISALWYYKEKVLDKLDVDENTTIEIITEKINTQRLDVEKRKDKTQQAQENINDCLDIEIK